MSEAREHLGSRPACRGARCGRAHRGSASRHVGMSACTCEHVNGPIQLDMLKELCVEMHFCVCIHVDSCICFDAWLCGCKHLCGMLSHVDNFICVPSAVCEMIGKGGCLHGGLHAVVNAWETSVGEEVVQVQRRRSRSAGGRR